MKKLRKKKVEVKKCFEKIDNKEDVTNIIDEMNKAEENFP